MFARVVDELIGADGVLVGHHGPVVGLAIDARNLVGGNWNTLKVMLVRSRAAAGNAEQMIAASATIKTRFEFIMVPPIGLLGGRKIPVPPVPCSWPTRFLPQILRSGQPYSDAGLRLTRRVAIVPPRCRARMPVAPKGFGVNVSRRPLIFPWIPTPRRDTWTTGRGESRITVKISDQLDALGHCRPAAYNQTGNFRP